MNIYKVFHQSSHPVPQPTQGKFGRLSFRKVGVSKKPFGDTDYVSSDELFGLAGKKSRAFVKGRNVEEPARKTPLSNDNTRLEVVPVKRTVLAVPDEAPERSVLPGTRQVIAGTGEPDETWPSGKADESLPKSSVVAKTSDSRLTFDTLFARLPEPSSWRSDLALLVSFSKGRLGFGGSGDAAPDRKKTNWFTKQVAAASSWLNAHVRFGLFAKGRGPHFHAIKDVLVEKAEFEVHFQPAMTALNQGVSEAPVPKSGAGRSAPRQFHTANASPEFTIFSGQSPLNDQLSKEVSQIYDEMLETLNHLERIHEDNPAFLGRRETWISIVLKFFRQYARKVKPLNLRLSPSSYLPRALRYAPDERNFLEELLHRSKALSCAATNNVSAQQVISKLERLIDKGAFLSLKAKETSALVAQLAMDQATLNGLGALADTAYSDINKVVFKRKNSKIQQLRGKGFASIAQIDHVFRAISYLTHGQSNPKHKLNKVLTDGGKIGNGEIASAYAKAIAGLEEGQKITLEGGWSRGLVLKWFLLGLKKTGFFGATANVGFEQSFRYTITFENVNGSIEIGFGRKELKGPDVGASGWLGFGVGAPKRGFFVGGSAGLNLTRRWGSEDRLRIKLDNSSPDLLTKLEHLLSGKISDPYEVLSLGQVSKTTQFNIKDTEVNLLVMPNGILSRSANVIQGLKTAFVPVYAKMEVELFNSSSRIGQNFIPASGAYQTERSHELYSFLTHKPKSKLGFGSAARVGARTQHQLSGNSRATEGRHNGGAATGNSGLLGEYESDRQTWREFFKRSPKAEFSMPVVQKNREGEVTDISWKMMLPRKENALKSPSLQKLAAADQHYIHNAVKDAVSFTSPYNKKEIKKKLEDITAEALQLGLDFSNELGFLESKSDFLSYKDRAQFKKVISKLKKKVGGHNSFKVELEDLEALTNDTKDTPWQRKSRSRNIEIEMKASEKEIAEYQSGNFKVNALKQEAIGKAQAVKVTENRSKETSGRWPLVFMYSSTSSLTATTSLTTWRIKSDDFKV